MRVEGACRHPGELPFLVRRPLPTPYLAGFGPAALRRDGTFRQSGFREPRSMEEVILGSCIQPQTGLMKACAY
jgi:hypothetical protein